MFSRTLWLACVSAPDRNRRAGRVDGGRRLRAGRRGSWRADAGAAGTRPGESGVAAAAADEGAAGVPGGAGRGGPDAVRVAVRLLPWPRRGGRRGRHRPDALDARRRGRARRSPRSGHPRPDGRRRGCRPSRCPTPTSPRSSRSFTTRRARRKPPVGGRRSVDVADLQTGNAEAGKRYFDGACARCHSPTGDLAGVGDAATRAGAAAAHAVPGRPDAAATRRARRRRSR